MKILLISSEFPPGPGGIGTHAFELARGLDGLGHDVEVVAPQDYVSAAEALAFRKDQPFKVIAPPVREGWLRRPANTLTFVRQLHDSDPDLLIISGGGAVRAAGLLAGRRPWIAIAYGTEIHAGGRVSRGLTRWGFGRATLVASVSQYTESQLIAAQVLPRRSTVVHNGADPTLEAMSVGAPRLDELLPVVAGCPVILTVGNVTERKGQEIVVRSMPAVLERVPDAHYVAIGLPTDRDAIERIARSLGVSGHVHLVGTVDGNQLAGAYRDATVLTMTSRHTADGDFEGFGIAAIEAALVGTPAVVSDSGGLPEAVIDGDTGVVVPASDIAATAAAIGDLLLDPDRVAVLGRAAYERAHRDLTWPRVVERYEALARSIVERRPATPPAGDAAPEAPRTLIFISDTPHYLVGDQPIGWAATIREIDVLSQLFDEIIHITPLYRGLDDFAMAPYRAQNVTMRFIRQAGGDHLREKIGVLFAVRSWSAAIADEMRRNPDALVHVRGPSSVALFAVLRSALFRTKVHWFKYAGNWMPDTELDYDPWSYGLQRMMLRTVHHGPITVNGRWPDQPATVRSFINPTYTSEELDEAREMAAGKTLAGSIGLLFVGRLYPTKGPLKALEITRRLRENGIDVSLDVVGDGPQREEMLQQIAAVPGLDQHVTLHGWVQRDQLAPLYAKAHFMVLPTEWEGFPKVLSEAMSFGVIPLAGAVSSIPQTLADLGVGYALPSSDIDRWVGAISQYINAPESWNEQSQRCLTSAQDFSFDTYLRNVTRLFHDFWGVDLTPRLPAPEAG